MFVTKKYRYKLPFAKILVAITVFGLAAYWFFHMSVTNAEGLIIDYVIHLTPHQANIFFGSFAVVSACFVLAGIVVLLLAIGEARIVSVTPHAVSGPKSMFSRTDTVIRFPDISNIGIEQVKSQKFVTIYASTGKLCFGRSMFKDSETFEDFLKSLTDNARAAKAGKI